jgi:starch synthase (maltosyl-transferring)
MNQDEQTIVRTPPGEAARRAEDARPGGLRRVYMANLNRSQRHIPAGFWSWIRSTRFDTLLFALPPHHGTSHIAISESLIDAAHDHGLRVEVDLVLDVARDAEPAVRHLEWFRALPALFADPRQAPRPRESRALDLVSGSVDSFAHHWSDELQRCLNAGIDGFRCRLSDAVPTLVWRELLASAPRCEFSLWAPGASAELLRAMPTSCFARVYNSLAWWDFASRSLREETERIAAVAPIANSVGLVACGPQSTAARHAARLLAVAANIGGGILSPVGFEFGLTSDLTHPEYGLDDWPRLREYALVDLSEQIRDANDMIAARKAARPARMMSSEHAPVAVLYEPPMRLTIANGRLDAPSVFDPASVLPLLDGAIGDWCDTRDGPMSPRPSRLRPAEVRVLIGEPAHAIAVPRADDDRDARSATAAPRVAIETVMPSIEGGRFAVKRVVGDRLSVEADIVHDGHGKISAALQWRARDERQWHESPMELVGDDRWSGEFLLQRVGRYLYRVIAWPDRFASWRDEFDKKRAAGLDVSLELEEGRQLVEAIGRQAPDRLDALVECLHRRNDTESLSALTGESVETMVAQADTRPGQVTSSEYSVDTDRRAAEFAAWYEMFPRNQTDDPGRHGTFRDVIPRLPAIRAMGFDVLYFPPIHPIGRTNRKGRDNALRALPGDPGSPYAIGASEGGHTAIHPQLGSIEDFRALRDAAAAHGLEIALDFAVQCSPDHPWLREHPEWFDWRPDGGLRYAENPPKKYEDIVNLDFHQSGAMPGLWLALRDVVAFWVREGIRLFRVDNPHTKPFPFWEWLIADIRARHPDTLFLSEAFTRPKVMYRLAKLGFSQSYTYFTWRNEKAELEAYLGELIGAMPDKGAVPDFFRPNFFVNTPDINPFFLQSGGRAGFLIRAALAATLSGLWGMLQGFEHCEAAPIPGREEYARSDKYEIRARPERSPGDIVDEITQLNRIRHENPALQSHRGLKFHAAWSDQMLWYRKQNIDRSNVLLIAVSVNPLTTQSATVEVPLWEWGLGDDASLVVDDLIGGGSRIWTGKHHTVTLDPHMLPYSIWRARPAGSV